MEKKISLLIVNSVQEDPYTSLPTSYARKILIYVLLKKEKKRYIYLCIHINIFQFPWDERVGLFNLMMP